MLRVALTGGAATGKSYVLDRFRRHGIPCLVADDLAHGVTAAGTEATSAIAARFGAGVIAQDGSVNREALGAIVFADDAARRELEAIVHPVVYRAIEAGMRAFAKLGDSTLAVVEIPLLYETGHTSDFDRVIVTTCRDDLQLQRLIDRGLGEARARQIVSAQKPAAEKVALADFVIRTDGEKSETDEQVRQILQALR
jgi:dephospho-CoA kinase